ncbi:TPA: TolC family protein [Legionella pneumophila]|nr:TolC family protein [Legionella pneumophila]HAU1657476.1 TolC family protein [Legionella pneumophila]
MKIDRLFELSFMEYHRVWRFAYGVVLLLLYASLVSAGKALTLKEITHIALANNKDLKAARYNVSVAKARLLQAGFWPNPSLNLSNNDDRLFTDEGEYSRSAGFSQAFPISGRIAKQKTVARLDVLKAVAEIREAERQLSAKVANAFYTAVITERRIQQVNYLLQINQELVDVIHNRYHAAEISKLDENAARIEYLRIVQEKHLLRSLSISQYATLNQLMGREANSSLSLKMDFAAEKKLPALDALKAQALKNRPDRQSIALLIERANADRRLAKAERFADWTVGVGIQQDKIVVEEGPPQPPDRTLGVMLSVPLPLLNRNQGRILEASHTGTQAIMSLRALDLSIATEIASNYEQIKALRKSLEETQRVSLQLTIENVKLARDSYENGQISFLNVLQVQKQQNDLQTTYLSTLEKFLQVYVALCTAIGPGKTDGFCSYLEYQSNGDSK